jgi:hypothetical protein
MSKRLWVITAYLALLALSLPIPLLHHYRTDKVIENLRPFIQLDDGSYAPLLMPVTLLFLRSLGHLAWSFTGLAFCFLLLSVWWDKFTRFSTIVALALCQCAFTTFYALYATYILGIEISVIVSM